MNLGAGFRLALGLLTIVPVRPPETIGREQARVAMLVAPLAVLPVTLMASGLGFGAVALGLPGLLGGVAAVGAMAFGTRAMHLDGLADTVDGLGSGRDASGALEIMKRGDVGPMGTVALVLVLLAQVIASGALLERPYGWLVVAVLLAVSRSALVLGCSAGLPAARPGGLGALVAESIPAAAAVVALAVWLAALQGLACVDGRAWWLPGIALIGAVVACTWLLLRSKKRFGGVTGDVLGAIVEVAATVLLVVWMIRA